MLPENENKTKKINAQNATNTDLFYSIIIKAMYVWGVGVFLFTILTQKLYDAHCVCFYTCIIKPAYTQNAHMKICLKRLVIFT